MDDTLTLSGVLGSTRRKGAWSVPARVVLRRRMGSAELDLTEAVLAAAHTTLDLDLIGGSVELRVPADMHVRSTVRTTMASVEDHRDHDPESAERVLTITGRAVWGSVEVRGPKKYRWPRTHA